MHDKTDEEYFSQFGENLTDKQKYILKGLFDYKLFRVSKAREEFTNSLKNTWLFKNLYKIINYKNN